MAKPKAYSYIRMSTPEQLKGDSLRRQLAKTDRYAAEHGLDVVDRFDDWGVSAYRGKNAEFGALARFRDLAQSGEIERGSYLIVESMDRLSRQNVMAAFNVLNSVIDCGITLVTLDDQQIYSEKTFSEQSYKLMIALGAMSRAHDESKRKSGLLSDSWEEKRRKARASGLILTGQVPAWLRVDRTANKIVEIPERAELIREIFTMARDGYGTYSIPRVLNQRGTRPWGTRKNAVWRESYIKKILANRAVLGEFQPHRMEIDRAKKHKRVPDGDVLPNYFPAVVSLQLFQETAAAIARRKKIGRGRKGKGYANLFTGMLRCRCSAGMRYVDKGAPPKGGKYLRCTVAFAGGTSCNAGLVRYEIVESAVLHAIESLDVEKVLGGGSRQQRLADRRHELSLHQLDAETIEKKIERVVEAITSVGSGVSPARLTAELTKLEKEKAALRTEIESAERDIDEMLAMNPETRKKVIGSLLGTIRSPDDPSTVEKTRRALVSELQRLIESITVTPSVHVAWEEMDNDPNWKTTYRVRTKRQLEIHLKQFGFSLNIRYRNGDNQILEGPKGELLKLKWDRKFKDLRMLAERSAS